MDRLSDYDFVLPEDRIAQVPLEDRAASKLLALDKVTGEVRHMTFRDAPSLLEPGDLLVVNRTRVTAKRLYGHRISSSGAEPRTLGGKVELLLLRRLPGVEGLYEAMTRPAKRFLVGAAIELAPGVLATVVQLGEDGRRIVKIEPESEIERLGLAPLPPYIHAPLADTDRYQTVYARKGANDGSAAAPTAGLHFTKEILEEVKAKGVQIAEVELSIGLDTFRPVHAEDLNDHQMQGEWCHLPPETADLINATKGQIIAVGTTTTRTLETFARAARDAGQTALSPGSLSSKLFLRPGNPLLLVNALFTNFHMPRTSMLMMLSALASREYVLDAYQEALKEGYRFLSFGDSMFLGNLGRTR